MKYLSLLTLSVAMLAAPAWASEAALQLAQKNNCMACHALENKLVGPAWNDVGRKYAGDATAQAKLIAKIKKGGVGAWGQIPMPPNVTIKEVDIKTIVQFILTLK